MSRFRDGEFVRWDKFRGRIVRRIDDKYYLVEDRTGLPPRIVKAERLQPGEPYQLPQPKDAA